MTDEETNETIMAGMGELHLEIYVERIRREYKVECTVGEPRVAYRECPTRAVEFNYKHKKQTGYRTRQKTKGGRKTNARQRKRHGSF